MGCGAHLQAPSTGYNPTGPDVGAHPTGPSSTNAKPIRLSVTNLQLPEPWAGVSVAERQFYAAATRAVRHVYEDDVDDSSQLLALRQRLMGDVKLAGARPVWATVLETSLGRAQTLRALGPTLRALRQALANTWRDEVAKSYRDIDAASCRMAGAQMPSTTDAAWPLTETVVTIEPLGAYPLGVLLTFCGDPRILFDQE